MKALIQQLHHLLYRIIIKFIKKYFSLICQDLLHIPLNKYLLNHHLLLFIVIIISIHSFEIKSYYN